MLPQYIKKIHVPVKAVQMKEWNKNSW